MVYPGFKYETDVDADGTVTLKLPLPPGTRVEIVVLAPEVDGFSDLVEASASSTAFWDNAWDDEDWNDADPLKLEPRSGGWSSAVILAPVR